MNRTSTFAAYLKNLGAFCLDGGFRLCFILAISLFAVDHNDGELHEASQVKYCQEFRNLWCSCRFTCMLYYFYHLHILTIVIITGCSFATLDQGLTNYPLFAEKQKILCHCTHCTKAGINTKYCMSMRCLFIRHFFIYISFI